MGIMQKAKDKAQQVVGSVKEKAGTATDDPKLHAQGTAEKTEGQAKEGMHDLAENVKGKANELKGKIQQGIASK